MRPLDNTSRVRRAVRVAQGAMLGAVIVLVIAATVLAGQEPDGRRAPGASSMPTADRATVLLERHDCWTGEAPPDMAGKVPGHVVVTLPDGRTVLGGERLVGQALEQIFEGRDRDLHVKGFCP